MVSFFTSVTSFLCATILLRDDRNQATTVARLPHGQCPWCCPVDPNTDVQYLLYTRSNPTIGYLLSYEDPGSTVLQVGVNTSHPTIVYLHGFTERVPGPAATAIRDAYLSVGDYNVILVDWSILSAAPWYVGAVRNTRLLGRLLATFLLRLDNSGVLPLRGVHVIGFSLGAEAAAFAGKAMPENRPIPRITGLDPAYPLYEFRDRTGRLSAGDALFVDVIHTDAGLLGFPTPIGDVDFYPNGRKPLQPGCQTGNMADYTRRLALITGSLSCSHIRAWQYYAESVRNPQGFPATRCPRWAGFLPPCRFVTENFMGLLANPRAKGKFYLETNSQPPFAKAAP